MEELNALKAAIQQTGNSIEKTQAEQVLVKKKCQR
jgi:hypothetical protein